MKFPLLSIENFLAITKAEVNLADRGLVLIQGKNNADSSANSNGAGKSSIADALCWALYGTTARGVSGDDVVNSSAGKNCRVSVKVEDAAGVYTITRFRKHSMGKNSLQVIFNDGLRVSDLTKGTDKLTQEVVGQIIGASLDVFAGSIYAGQEHMPDLPSMTDKMLKTLIEEAAGVDVLEAAYVKARENLRITDQQIAISAETLRKEVDNCRLFEQQMEAAELRAKQWEVDCKVKIDDIDRVGLAKLAEVKEIRETTDVVDAENLASRIAEIDNRLSLSAAENKQLLQHQDMIKELEGELRLVRANVKRETDFAKNALGDLKDVNHRVGCPCSECGRVITASEIAASKSNLEGVVRKHVGESKKHQETEKKLLEAIREATEERDRFMAGMTDVTTELALRKALQGDLDHFHALEAQERTLMSQIKTLKEQVEGLMKEPNPHLETMDHFREKLEEARMKSLRTSRSIESLQRSRAVDDEVVRVFSPAGVRARVLDEITPFLNAQTSTYLSVLSDGNISATWTTLTRNAKGELREKFSIDVENAVGGKSFGLISGGEKRKVRLATAIALQDLVATRASKAIELFIGDEIDDALDPAGLERLVSILEEKARDRGSVFVISHNDLDDYIKQVLLVEKAPSGETTVTETTI